MILDRIEVLVADGKSLSDSCEYSSDDIRTKCTELQSTSEKLREGLKAKRAQLLQVMELHQKLQSVRET